MRNGFITFVVQREDSGQVVMKCDQCGRRYLINDLMTWDGRLKPWIATRVLAHGGAHDIDDIRLQLDISFML